MVSLGLLFQAATSARAIRALIMILRLGEKKGCSVPGRRVWSCMGNGNPGLKQDLDQLRVGFCLVSAFASGTCKEGDVHWAGV